MKITILTLLILIQTAFAGDAKPCIYLPVDELEPIQVDNCIDFVEWEKRPNNSDALITKYVAMTATYDSDDIAYLSSEFGPFYFLKSGLARKTIYYDNGPDYFQEGFARTSWNGKIGFIDKKLTIIIPPSYDFAFPFQDGVSLVCNGCKQQADGEHTEMVGGKWGFINISGNVVIPISYSKQAAIEVLNKAKHRD